MPEGQVQTTLLVPVDRERVRRLMGVLDGINGRYGKGKVEVAAVLQQQAYRKALPLWNVGGKKQFYVFIYTIKKQKHAEPLRQHQGLQQHHAENAMGEGLP